MVLKEVPDFLWMQNNHLNQPETLEHNLIVAFIVERRKDHM